MNSVLTNRIVFFILGCIATSFGYFLGCETGRQVQTNSFDTLYVSKSIVLKTEKGDGFLEISVDKDGKRGAMIYMHSGVSSSNPTSVILKAEDGIASADISMGMGETISGCSILSVGGLAAIILEDKDSVKRLTSSD